MVDCEHQWRTDGIVLDVAPDGIISRRCIKCGRLQQCGPFRAEGWKNTMESRYAFEYERLAVALRELPLNDTVLQAIAIICRVLKEQNPRFDAGLFSEWCLENK